MIHPIAGKCKHCKAELTSYHAARPAANMPLPALHAGPGGHGQVNGHAASPSPAAHAPIATAHEVSQPVLPPRPTGHLAASEPAAGWRSWPVLVIVVATVAIVVAAVLMVWPAGRDRDGKRAVQPPPAPDRMDTQSPASPPRVPHAALPPPAAPDPWKQAPPAALPAPAAPDPSADLTDDDDSPDPPRDPYSSPHGAAAPRGGHKPPINSRGMVVLAMAEHLCKKIVACGSDDASMKTMCDTVGRSQAGMPANCPVADRCLQHIDTMSCTGLPDDFSQLTTLLTQFHDCADAIRC